MYNPNAPFAKDAKKLQSYGTGGDSVLAHINPDEARALQRAGGMSVNPITGLPEYGLFSKIGSFFKSAAGKKVKDVAGQAAAGYLTGGSRGAKAGAVGSLIGGTKFGQTGAGQALTGAAQGYLTGGRTGAIAALLGQIAPGMMGGGAQGGRTPAEQAQFAAAIAQAQNLADKASREAAAQTEELKKLGKPFIDISQELLDRYRKGELSPQEKAAIDEQLKQADVYKGMAAPFQKQYEEMLGRYQRGELAPAEQAAFEEQMKAAGRFEELAKPLQGISQELLDRYKRGN